MKVSITLQDIHFTQEPALARRMISMMPQLHAPLAGVSLRQSIEAIARIRGSYGERAERRSRGSNRFIKNQ